MAFPYRAALALILPLIVSCSHLSNEAYLRQACSDYAAALEQAVSLRAQMTPADVAQINAVEPATTVACSPAIEPSNPSDANAQVKYGRNVVRGVLDAVLKPTPVEHTGIVAQATTAVHEYVLEDVLFAEWKDIVASVRAAAETWHGSARNS